MALVEALNAIGVAFASDPSSAASQQSLGSHLTIASIAIQLGVIISFLCIASVFHYRCVKANIHAKAVSTPMITLYISMALILVRCIYRLVEHQGNTAVDLDNPESLRNLSPIVRFEWFFFVFESTLMLLNSALWNIWNPGRYLPGNYHVHLAEDGRTELVSDEDADDRPFLAKAAHVFTFGLFFRRKTMRYQPSRELGQYSVVNRQD